MAGQLGTKTVLALTIALFAAGCTSDPASVAQDTLAAPTATVAEIETASVVEPSPTPTAIPTVAPSLVPTAEAAVSSSLLPPSDEWVIVEHFSGEEAHTNRSGSSPGTWAWRVDGQLVLLHAGTRYDVPSVASPELATIQRSHNRSVLSWEPDGKRVSLIGFDIDDAELATLASRLDFDGEMWTLPDATVLAAEALPKHGVTDEQVTFAPVRADGSADLSATVGAMSGLGSPGVVYRQVVSWSELGDVSEIMIAGHAGVVVKGKNQADSLGPRGSWAAVEVDGRVFTWSTTYLGAADTDQLVTMLESMQVASEAEWLAAIDAVDDEIAKATAAVGINPAEVAPPTVLPRYVLPDDWTLERVTDKGIWTPEQRAGEIARSVARQPAELRQGWPVHTRTQGFGYRSPEDRGNELVMAVIINTSVFDDDRGIPEQPTNYTPIELGELSGSAYGGSAELYGPNLGVFMRGSTLDESELLDFVQALSPRNGDPTQGFDITDDRYVQVFETTGNERPGDAAQRPVSKWAMFWSHDDSGAEAAITARIISYTDLQQRLTYRQDSSPLVQTIVGNSDSAFVTGESTRGDMYWVYDTQAQLLIEVRVQVSKMQARDLFESFIPIGIDDWTELAAPLNTQPR